MLFGSSILPSMIWNGRVEVTLGDVVRRAFQDSSFTADEWNGLDPLVREALLAQAIYKMRAEVEAAKPNLTVNAKGEPYMGHIVRK
jgi:hypothetical protein